MSDINTWIKRLSEKALPVLPETCQQLRELMENENLSISLYAGPVLHDPGMALALLQDVNRQKASQQRDFISTITNVMPHLGPARVRQHMQKALLLDDLKLSPRHHEGFMRYLTQACHGAYLTRDWAQQRHTIEPEEMSLGALLYNVAELALWCYGDDAMLQIEDQVYIQKQPYEKACKAVLGCDIRQLGAALAEAWFLPEIAVNAQRSSMSGFTLTTGIALAGRLARLSSTSWYGREALDCVQLIADYQGHSIAEVEHHLHLNCVEFADYLPNLLPWTPARNLPMLADDDYIDRRFEYAAKAGSSLDDADSKEVKQQPTEEKPSTPVSPQKSSSRRDGVAVETASAGGKSAVNKPAAKAPIPEAQAQSPKAENEKARQGEPADRPRAEKSSRQLPAHTAEEMARQISLLQAMIKRKDSVAHIIQQGVNAAYTLGFERAVFIIKLPKQEEMVAKFFCQDESAHELKPFKVSLDKPHLFKLLMAKPQNIWINKDNKAKYWNMIPANIKLALHNDCFFASSVFVNKKPVGLMYVDKPSGQLNETEYKKFQGLCRMLSKGLTDIVQQKARPAK